MGGQASRCRRKGCLIPPDRLLHQPQLDLRGGCSTRAEVDRWLFLLAERSADLFKYSRRLWGRCPIQLHRRAQGLVDGGMNTGDVRFINGASGIVNRGCHNPPNCGTGVLDGERDRQTNFKTMLTAMGLRFEQVLEAP